jgi:hypothetical protein
MSGGVPLVGEPAVVDCEFLDVPASIDDGVMAVEVLQRSLDVDGRRVEEDPGDGGTVDMSTPR